MRNWMNRRRTTLLLVAFLVVIAMFAAVNYFSASSRYRRQQDVVTLRYILSTQVRPSESKRRVTSLLGRGTPDDGTHLSRLLKWQDGPHFQPEFFPEGIEARDQLIYFAPNPKSTYMLQFRDERLVNFDPHDYVGSDDLISSLCAN